MLEYLHAGKSLALLYHPLHYIMYLYSVSFLDNIADTTSLKVNVLELVKPLVLCLKVIDTRALLVWLSCSKVLDAFKSLCELSISLH